MHTTPFLAIFVQPSAEHNFLLLLLLRARFSRASSSSTEDDFRVPSSCVVLLSELIDAVVSSEVSAVEALCDKIVLSDGADEEFLFISAASVVAADSDFLSWL